MVDAEAEAAGVQPGQRLATALALAPGLQARPRDRRREQDVLHELACWAGRFTPTLSLQSPAGLLLDIGGCLRLFGGLDALGEAVLGAARAQGWLVAAGIAPTPLAARWLSQAAACDAPPIAASAATLERLLADLPCQVAASASGWPSAVLPRLESFGCQTLGDLFNLPGAALRQRLGSAPLDDLLRARGLRPDPQATFVFPARFEQHLELPARVESAEGLWFAAQRLLAALTGWLRARQRRLLAASLYLEHERRTEEACSRLPLRVGEATADELRLSRLLREHLARQRLPAPVVGLRLTADEVVAAPGESAPLLGDTPGGEGTQACIERLRARLGHEAVQTLAWHPDHRPECATRFCDPAPGDAVSPSSGTGDSVDRGSASPDAPLRPLWLLPAPQALGERGGIPQWRGPLQLQGGGERIESGWWDAGEGEGDQRRDYFVAQNPAGQWLWVFRDAGGWFLHGLFA